MIPVGLAADTDLPVRSRGQQPAGFCTQLGLSLGEFAELKNRALRTKSGAKYGEPVRQSTSR